MKINDKFAGFGAVVKPRVPFRKLHLFHQHRLTSAVNVNRLGLQRPVGDLLFLRIELRVRRKVVWIIMRVAEAVEKRKLEDHPDNGLTPGVCEAYLQPWNGGVALVAVGQIDLVDHHRAASMRILRQKRRATANAAKGKCNGEQGKFVAKN